MGRMQVFGIHEGRRVVVEISGRDGALRMVDDETGTEIGRHHVGSGEQLSLSGNSLMLGLRAVTLDRGEETSAQELLRTYIGGGRLGNASPGAGTIGAEDPRIDWSPPTAPNVDDISEDELEREVSRQDVIAVARRAASVAGIVTALLVLFGVVAVVAGVFVATQTESTLSGTEHSRLGTGITLALAGLVEMCVGLMLSLGIGAVARYIRHRAEFDPIR
jgi:hypothetical protein